MKESGKIVERCQICDSNRLYPFLSLGHQPPSDAFLEKEQQKKEETYYPLDVHFCEDCNLVQLGYVVNPKELFYEGYSYNTKTSGELVANFANLTANLIKRFNLTHDDLAVDIGSNDGTLLDGFLKSNVRILGIEPTGVARLALEKNIPTLKKFFNKELAGEIIQQYGPAKIITATNVFAHIDGIHGIVEGIEKLLTEDGVFISESHYLLDLIEKMEYDSIYHEHLRYYSLKPLIKLFEMHGMEVFDVERITTHGGSLRVYSCKMGAHPISDNVRKIIELEEKFGLYSRETFTKYRESVNKSREGLMKILNDIKNGGNRIIGIGAPAKGNTLLNYCHINNDILDYLAEKSDLKRGLFSPGMHIEVVDEKNLFEEPQPPYALVLAWNLKDIIIPKLKEKGFKGKFIIPVPTPHIVS
jgi:hypothetical protein